jgi:hypothetical protein
MTLFLFAIVALVLINCGSDEDIAIEISETEEALTVYASYPDKDSKLVHDYVRSKLKMTDITDLHHLEVKKYQTPDQQMNFHIKSRDGYLKIVLDKSENTRQSYLAMKRTGQGLQTLFQRR